MRLVDRLTRLNARHIAATSRLAGIEIELLGVGVNPDRSAAPHASAAATDDAATERAERERLERDRMELSDARAAIERERDALDRELQTIDDALASPARAPGSADERR